MVYVYIIKSEKDHGFYIGISKNTKERLIKHNNSGVRSTKNRRPWKLVHTELYNDYKEARIREIQVKSYKGGIAFKNLIAN